MPRAKKPNEKEVVDSVAYVKPPEDFLFVYANNANINLGQLDASLIFGEIVGNDEDGKNLVIPKVKVVMALPFVRALQALLTSDAVNDHFKNLKPDDVPKVRPVRSQFQQ